MDGSLLDEIYDDHEANAPAAAGGPPPETPPDAAPGDKSRDWDKYRDKYGRPFDADLHRVDKDGNPRINKRDGFLSIRPGKGKPVKAPGPQVAGPAPQAQAPGIVDLDAPAPVPDGPTFEESLQAAVICLTLFETGISTSLGPAWKFRRESMEVNGQVIDANEMDLFSDPLARIFHDQGVGDLPPGIALVGASIMYVTARISDEKAGPQVKGAFGWVKQKARAIATWFYLRFRR